MISPRPRVILITDPRYEAARVDAVVRTVAHELGPGRLAVQLRDKAAPLAELARHARRLRSVTREAGAWFVVNGSVDVAVDARADGVHCPDRDDVAKAREKLGANAFVSVPAHDDDDIRAAVTLGVSAMLVSPIYASPGKGAPRGEDALRHARAIVDDAAAESPTPGGGLTRSSVVARPLLFALGGVTVERARDCQRAGADGVAILRGLLDHEAERDPGPLRAVARRLGDVLSTSP